MDKKLDINAGELTTEMTDEELEALTGGASYASDALNPGCIVAPIMKYGIKPMYGITPVLKYGIIPLYGITPVLKYGIMPLYGITPDFE